MRNLVGMGCQQTARSCGEGGKKKLSTWWICKTKDDRGWEKTAENCSIVEGGKRPGRSWARRNDENVITTNCRCQGATIKGLSADEERGK